MDQLYACPFCRELYQQGEVEVCPECDIPVKPLTELPLSPEAQALEEQIVPPEHESFSWLYAGRARGPLVVVALCGIGAFFAPWLNQTAPYELHWSGFEFARQLPWLWAAGVAWPVMLAVVISRRSIHQMRGARVAVAFLATMVVATVVMRWARDPSSPYPGLAVRFVYDWGMYTAGFLGLLAFGLALRFGGSLDDMPTTVARHGDETLH